VLSYQVQGLEFKAKQEGIREKVEKISPSDEVDTGV
jgi:hypothetical protein